MVKDDKNLIKLELSDMRMEENVEISLFQSLVKNKSKSVAFAYMQVMQ